MIERRIREADLFSRVHDAAADYLDASRAIATTSDRARVRLELALEELGDLLTRANTHPPETPLRRAWRWLRYKLRPRADHGLLVAAIAFFQLAAFEIISTHLGITMGLTALTAGWILGPDD